MASDLVAPILLMIILFALNGVVIFYIHKARKNFFRQTRSSKFDNQSEKGLVSYGSMDSNNSCFSKGKSSKSKTKNWALSLKINNERRP